MLIQRMICLCLLLLTKYNSLKVLAEPPPPPPVNGVRASNILGGLQQHASFSFVRPGLTQTAFAFNGPSSHQAFSSSIGDPHLAHRVQPSLAQALAYRNPGLGFAAYGNGHVATGYASGTPTIYQPQQHQQFQQPTIDYQQYQQILAQSYYQQQQQQQHHLQQQQQQYQYQQPQQQAYSGSIDAQQQQAHLAQLFASRYANAPHQQSSLPEQIQLQQQEQQQHQLQEQPTTNLLGVAYSAAPSVAHVKIDGNGYKVDF